MMQMGSYDELINSSASFAHLLADIHQQEQEIMINVEKQLSVISSIYSEKDHEEELVENLDVKQEGSIKWKVYISYMSAGLGSAFGFVFLLLIFAIHEGLAMYSSWWLATWSDDESHRHRNFNHCIAEKPENVYQIQSMTEQQWEMHRSQRFYTYGGELDER